MVELFILTSLFLMQQKNVVGLSCLHCMHPRAVNAHQIISLLNEAKSATATNIIIDGSFGYSSKRFRKLVEELAGKDNTLVVYLSNGPWERKPWNNWYLAREYHRNFKPYLRDFQWRALDRKDDLEYASKLVDLIIAPALEDNYTDDEFRKLQGIMETTFEGMKVRFLRNPCAGGKWVPRGWLKEVHSLTGPDKGFLVSNDGVEVSLDRARQLRSKYSMFILWHGARQGRAGLKSVPPDERNYQRIGRVERKRLLRFLNGR